MAAKKPPPTIEARILAALRRDQKFLTVAKLRGHPGLRGRRSSDVARACQSMADRGDLVETWELSADGRGVSLYTLQTTEDNRGRP